MTKEEAIKTLKENYCAMCAYGSQDMDSCDIRSCDNKDAIKVLEQKPFINKPCIANKICHEDKVKVLDKIRAEIDLLSDSRCDGTTITIYSWNGMKRRVLEIIDKYKEESEE